MRATTMAKARQSLMRIDNATAEVDAYGEIHDGIVKLLEDARRAVARSVSTSPGVRSVLLGDLHRRRFSGRCLENFPVLALPSLPDFLFPGQLLERGDRLVVGHNDRSSRTDAIPVNVRFRLPHYRLLRNGLRSRRLRLK